MWNLKTQTHAHTEFKDAENRLVIARGDGAGRMGEGGQKGQTTSYKVNSKDVMYSTVIIANTVLHI